MLVISYVFAGFFVVNGIPHFTQGLAGNRFQSPFAKPPGVGESSALINVLWGAANLLIGYALLGYAGFFQPGLNLPSYLFFGSGLITAITLALHFCRVRNN